MNIVTRRLALMLAAVLLVIASAGCRSNDQQRLPSQPASSAPPEHLEISVAIWELTDNPLAEDPLVQRLEKKLNITIKPIPMTTANYVQQFQMWASSGQLPDIFAVDAVNTQYYRNWRDQGVIKPLPSDLSAYPYLNQYLATTEFQDLKNDGKLYFIPRKTYDSTEYNVLDRLVVYRWDLAQQAGITKEPETWDEFRTMLKAIVEKDPENKHITGLTSVSKLLLGGLFWLYGSPAATSDGSGSDFKWIKEDGRYIPAVFSKHAVESLKLLRELYAAGLIDPDLPLTRGNMAVDKFAEGKVAAIITSGMFRSVDTNMNKNRWQKLHPEDKGFYDSVRFLKPLPSMDGNRYSAVFKTFWSESYISSKVSEAKMDRILQLFDYMNSPEFLEMRHYGLLDVDYTKSGDTIRKIDPNTNILLKYPSFTAFANLANWDGMFGLDPNFSGISPEAYDAQQELIDYAKRMTSKQAYEPRLTNLSTPTKDTFTIFDNDDMIRVMISKLPVEVIWKSILDGYKAKGLDRMINEVNAEAKKLGIE
ncbi:extracellular solute-binding protein [Paenibacillus sp. BC26]|uniref:extracellular solute-binding protein n=1 Tax=Paenibacillus sp. BC26 TaxID=1881032 RepID=UPI0008E05F0F|nr:extracellular solute-binding protein [Paenibacillus sp. BC26]SFT13592.1 putative aldouronate transport system substrate-binding protein [Paenibacillus sp. BC26]